MVGNSNNRPFHSPYNKTVFGRNSCSCQVRAFLYHPPKQNSDFGTLLPGYGSFFSFFFYEIIKNKTCHPILMNPESHREHSPLAGYILYMRDMIQEHKNIHPFLNIACYDWQATQDQVSWKLRASLSLIKNHYEALDSALLLYNRTTRTCELQKVQQSRRVVLEESVLSSLEKFHNRTISQERCRYDLDFVVLASLQPPQPPGGLRLVA